MKLEMELRHLFHIVLDKLACADYRMFQYLNLRAIHHLEWLRRFSRVNFCVKYVRQGLDLLLPLNIVKVSTRKFVQGNLRGVTWGCFFLERVCVCLSSLDLLLSLLVIPDICHGRHGRRLCKKNFTRKSGVFLQI